MNKDRINLGDYVKDTVTSYRGVVTGRAIYLSGCIQFFVEGRYPSEKIANREIWIDEQRLKVVKRGFFSPLGSAAEVGGMKKSSVKS